MSWCRRWAWSCVLVVFAFGVSRTPGQQTTSSGGVGDGAPTPAILANILAAFARAGFSTQVALPPRDKVHRNGPGYVQDFDAASASGFSYLIAQSDSNLLAAFQMCCQILDLHTQIGSFTGKIGYPVGDFFAAGSGVDGAASLQQNFEGGHAVVAIQSGTYAGQTFFIRDPYVSRWRVTSALGFPISQEHDTTSRFSTTATQQDFQGGVIVQITSGNLNTQVFTTSGPIYQTYFAIGGTGSWLGFPIGDEFTYSGRQRQNFEGGYLDYIAGSGVPAATHAPVSAVVIDATPLNLQVGNVVSKSISIYDSLNNPLGDRPVTWTTSNRAVVQIEGSGLTVTLRAVGPGFATVTAIVDGISSATVRVTVTSVCCLVGEGAPNAIVRQAMQDALTRNSITPRLPTDNPTRRVGSGYVQEFTALTPASLGRFLVLKSENGGQAFIVSGDRLTKYQQLGGVTGPLGFAISDANAAGRQLFENNYAVGGSPPVVVGPPVTQKWAALNYESGPAGAPSADATAAGPSPYGSAGVAQPFASGVIYAYTAGARSGQAYFVSGLILARYNKLAGPTGALGWPISDAFPSGARTQQNFEGGSIDVAPGDAEAAEHLTARAPAVSVFPSQATIGSRVRVSISGFTPGRRLIVSLTSQPDFEVTPGSGAFGWDQMIVAGTAAATYRVSVRDAAGSDRAETSYRVRATAEVPLQLTKVSGDNQSALPASEAALPLVVRLADDGGSPIAGARVTFATIAGAAVSPADAFTDANGLAQTKLRLPPQNGLSLATAETNGRVVTFAARAEDSRLASFPTFRQSIDDIKLGGGSASIHKKGSLLTAVAALLRYYQDRSELPASSGLADPAALNQFLLAGGFLPFTLNGRTELVMNPVRALSFVSDAGDFESITADRNTIRDSLNQRRPVLIGLMLRAGDQNKGAHYVVAVGVGADGQTLIHDPSPDWNRSTLEEYLSGFPALGRNWTGTMLHALRLRIEPRSARGFLVTGPGAARLRVASTTGRSYQLRIPAEAAFDEDTADNGDTTDVWYLDGTASQYQMTAAAGGVAVRGPSLFDSLGPGVFRISPVPTAFAVAPQTLAASADGLRNTAGFGARLAPGMLAALFASGLADDTNVAPRLPLPATLGGLHVTVGNVATPVLFVSPFQANIQLPFGLAPGAQTVEVASNFGAARFDVTLDEAAPGIFLVGTSAGAVLNQDGSFNTPLNPARRGTALQVFMTGLGGVAPAINTGAPAPGSPLSSVAALPTATLDGQPLTVLFAGLAPGFAGLYQINLLIPPSLAPIAAARLVIRAAGQDSNAVPAAVQ